MIGFIVAMACLTAVCVGAGLCAVWAWNRVADAGQRAVEEDFRD